MAYLGLLDDAAPRFRPGTRVPGAGVLLSVPGLIQSGIIECADEVYGSIGPAFFGLRTTVVALVLMALLRVKRPEGLKERPPEDLDRILGLDRAPEVKTVRRKLTRLAALGRAAQFGRELARRRLAAHGTALGFLYVDGHVRVYHGDRSIPKAHVARLRLPMPATTELLGQRCRRGTLVRGDRGGQRRDGQDAAGDPCGGSRPGGRTPPDRGV